jgi:hypothetical protein
VDTIAAPPSPPLAPAAPRPGARYRVVGTPLVHRLEVYQLHRENV